MTETRPATATPLTVYRTGYPPEPARTHDEVRDDMAAAINQHPAATPPDAAPETFTASVSLSTLYGAPPALGLVKVPGVTSWRVDDGVLTVHGPAPREGERGGKLAAFAAGQWVCVQRDSTKEAR